MARYPILRKNFQICLGDDNRSFWNKIFARMREMADVLQHCLSSVAKSSFGLATFLHLEISSPAYANLFWGTIFTDNPPCSATQGTGLVHPLRNGGGQPFGSWLSSTSKGADLPV